jgi:DNA-binding response OmpR family regulator
VEHKKVEFIRKTVLVADPDVDIRNLLLRELSLEGVKVETASSGAELLQKFYRIDADALIVEAELPDIKTGTIIDTVKRSLPKLPIIVIAANRSEEFEKIIRERGVFYYVTKPFSIELLKLVIKDALAGKKKIDNREATDAGQSAIQKSAPEQ